MTKEEWIEQITPERIKRWIDFGRKQKHYWHSLTQGNSGATFFPEGLHDERWTTHPGHPALWIFGAPRGKDGKYKFFIAHIEFVKNRMIIQITSTKYKSSVTRYDIAVDKRRNPLKLLGAFLRQIRSENKGQ